jgi:hypothetical protein
MQNLKYQFEYFCSPIWIIENNRINPIYQNVSVLNLPISELLKKEIGNLQEIFQSTYNDVYPPEPIELPKEEDLLFTSRILSSFELLTKELSGKYNLVFDKSYWSNRLLRLRDSNSNV